MCIPAAIFEYEEEMKTFLILGQNPSGAKAFKNNTIDRLSKWLDYAGITDYDFDNVSYSGQTARLNMLSELGSYAKSASEVGANALDATAMKNMFANENSPFADADLNVYVFFIKCFVRTV